MADERMLLFFPTPVIIGAVDDAESLNTELETVIRKRMKADKGVIKSNIGGWHSKTDLFEWTGEAGQRVAQSIIELANAHTVGIQGKSVNIRWRLAGWANVSGPMHSNQAHIHPAAYWSAVYYVRIGEGAGGHLLLHDPRMPALRMHAPGLRFKDCGPDAFARVKPAAGQIVLFPSWLSHSVEPWEGDSERISIAINLTAPLPPPAGAEKQPRIAKETGKK
jgi:uncharacterized protein (TIGR02466 family)